MSLYFARKSWAHTSIARSLFWMRPCLTNFALSLERKRAARSYPFSSSVSLFMLERIFDWFFGKSAQKRIKINGEVQGLVAYHRLFWGLNRRFPLPAITSFWWLHQAPVALHRPFLPLRCQRPNPCFEWSPGSFPRHFEGLLVDEDLRGHVHFLWTFVARLCP